MFRLRERDFGAIIHKDGISPAWPIPYDEFEPYYGEAEALFHVHGATWRGPKRTGVDNGIPVSASLA